MKKCLSIVLSCAMVLSMIICVTFATPVIASAASGNIIQNGDFESGSEGWATPNCTVLTDEGAYSGNTYVRLGGYTWYRLEQVVNVEKNTDYKLSFYAKGEVKATCRVTPDNNFDSTNGLLSKDFNELSDWKRIVTTFNSGDNETVHLWFDPSGSPNPLEGKPETAEENRMLIDNVKIEKLELNNGLIYNGGFEAGAAGWNMTNSGQTPVCTNDADYPAYSGDSCLRLAGYRSHKTDAYVYQELNVEPNKDYFVKFYAKGLKRAICQIVNEPGFQYEQDLITEDGNKPSNSCIATLGRFGWTEGEWREYSFTFNSGDNTKLYIQFDFLTANLWDGVNFTPADYMTIDDVSVIEIYNGLVYNGDLEAKNSGWADANCNFITGDDAYSGNTYARLMGYTWSRLKQVINVEKNTDYKISFYAKGKTKANCLISATDGWAFTGLVSKDFENLSDWTRIVATFNSGDNEKIYLWFDPTGSPSPLEGKPETAAENRMSVDNIKIEKLELNNGLIYNGGFEAGAVGWTVCNETEICTNVSDYPAHSGDSCLRLAKFRSNQCEVYVFQELTVKPNTEYGVSFYAKGNNYSVCQIVNEPGFQYGDSVNTTPVNSCIARADKDGTGQFGNTESKWSKVTLKFNSGDNTKLYIQFDFSAANAWDGYIYNNFTPTDYMTIDDVSVFTLGDLNSDGDVDLKDLIKMKKYLAKSDNDVSFTDADIDLNGKIDAEDLPLIRKMLLNK